MPNTLAIIRALLIYGLCIPAAILLGYLLATPMDIISFILVVLLLVVPLVPVLLRWHHFLLIASWHLWAVLFFLPGRPFVWIVLTFISLVLSSAQRILSREATHISVPSVGRPLLLLLLVVLVTAMMTGGIGMQALGSEVYGGRRYVLIIAAILGYFAISRVRVPVGREVQYATAFFLMGVTAVLGSLPALVPLPAGFYWVHAVFPVESRMLLFFEPSEDTPIRLASFSPAGTALLWYCLARYGLGGTFDLSGRWHLFPIRLRGGFQFQQPWRALLAMLGLWMVLVSGFRSALGLCFMVLTGLVIVERIYRRPIALFLVLAGMLAGSLLVVLAPKLPPMVQRTLSFLPLDIDPAIRMSAEVSTEWRVQMWENILPSVPKYLWLGKGYSINPIELERAQYSRSSEGAVGAMIAGDYHNGPLTLLVPLGIWGVLAFGWFLIAGFRALWKNYRYGDSALRQINAFLLVYFTCRVVFYLFVFGHFPLDLYLFTGVVALSISLNGGVRQPAAVPAFKPALGTLPLARATP